MPRRRCRGRPTHCYHSSGDNGGLKDFQTGSHLSREILKDFQFGSIGKLKRFQEAMSRRATDALSFAKSPSFPSYHRVYGRNKTFDMEERKMFISSDCNHLWQEKLYGITRVAVYGVDSICVVTRNKDLVQLKKDYARLWDTPYRVFHTPWDSLISEVEDLACLRGEESGETDRKMSQKPFGVVSVVEGRKKVHKVSDHEASSNKFDEHKAIKFLWEEMNNASTFTYVETIKTTICAFQHLFDKKFKPNEIRVFIRNRVQKTDQFVKNPNPKELKIRDERSINDVLAVINKRDILQDWLANEGS